jgi:hypothetical protein
VDARSRWAECRKPDSADASYRVLTARRTPFRQQLHLELTRARQSPRRLGDTHVVEQT